MDNEQERAVLDTRIRQKINAAHRGAFHEKYPGQLEHILRLITERLHAGLDKRDGVVINDPNTWLITAEEIRSLAEASVHINTIRNMLR